MSPKSKLAQHRDMRQTNSPPFELSWELLDRYYAGDVTREERMAVETYLTKHRDTADILRQVAFEIRGPVHGKHTSQEKDVSGMLATLHERMHPKMALKRLVQTCFGGSVQRAVAALLDVEDTDLTKEEIDRLRQAIHAATQEGR